MSMVSDRFNILDVDPNEIAAFLRRSINVEMCMTGREDTIDEVKENVTYLKRVTGALLRINGVDPVTLQ